MASHVAYIGNIDLVLDREVFGPYSAEVAAAVEKGIDDTGRVLKAETKRDAPIDGGKWQSQGFPPHRAGGTFKSHISHRRTGKGFNHRYKWFVKTPEHRLTHLLANGHRLFIFGKDAHKSTKAIPFVHDAYDHARADLPGNIIRRLP